MSQNMIKNSAGRTIAAYGERDIISGTTAVVPAAFFSTAILTWLHVTVFKTFGTGSVVKER